MNTTSFLSSFKTYRWQIELSYLWKVSQGRNIEYTDKESIFILHAQYLCIYQNLVYLTFSQGTLCISGTALPNSFTGSIGTNCMFYNSTVFIKIKKIEHAFNWMNLYYCTPLPMHEFLSSFLLFENNIHIVPTVIFQLLHLVQILHLVQWANISQSVTVKYML